MSKLTLLTNALDELEFAILEEALQDIYAKRVKEWRVACQISYFNGHKNPDRSEFKVDEVERLLADLNIAPFIDASQQYAPPSR